MVIVQLLRDMPSAVIALTDLGDRTYAVTIVLRILLELPPLYFSLLILHVLGEYKQQTGCYRKNNSRYGIADPTESRNGVLVEPGQPVLGA